MRGIVNHFNRGEVDTEALSRDDLKRVNSSASLMRNFIPSRLGNMSYRPGLKYLAELDNEDHHTVPFVSSITSTAILDFTWKGLSFIVDEEIVSASAVTTAFTNGEFNSDITGWTDASSGTASTAYGAGGYLVLTGDGTSNAVSYQTPTTETGVEHSMELIILDTSLVVKIGTTGVGSYDIFKGTLKPGTHILTFTPASDITLTFENSKKYKARVDSVSFLGDEVISFSTEIDDLESIRYKQSIDVVYITHTSGRQIQIEHRGDKSWSIVDYRSNDGPFGFVNSTNISLTPTALSGDTVLTASDDYFSLSDIGRLYKLSSQGQEVDTTISVDTGAGTDSVRVTGVDASRIINISATIPSGTVTLQRSVDDSLWEDVESYTVTTSKAYDDGYDNAILYYRLYVKAGDNAGLASIDLNITYTGGSIDGVCRVIGYTNETTVNIQILEEFGGTNATLDWYAGEWITGNYPVALDIFEGRLWFGGNDKVWGSVSDSYYSFDSSIEGNSQAIQKTIGFGSLDPIKWIKANYRLVVGTVIDEISIRSSSYGEGLTQSNTNIKSGSNQGSANVDPITIDDTVYFVQRSGVSLFSLTPYSDSDIIQTLDINLLNKDITSAVIKRIASTRQPETRIYCVLDDGTVAVYTADLMEEVSAWSRFTTNGLIKDVVVLPEIGEDRVYFVVLRNGQTNLERMNFFSETVTSSYDSYVSYASAGTTLTGLGHIEGEEVTLNGDGVIVGTYTVSSGSITVPEDYATAYVGLAYIADYTSNKLSGYMPESVLTERKRVIDTGLALMNYYQDAITIGPTEDLLRSLPSMEMGKDSSSTALIEEYRELPFPYDGKTESDPRIHMRATAPCKILALTYQLEDPNNPYSIKQ